MKAKQTELDLALKYGFPFVSQSPCGLKYIVQDMILGGSSGPMMVTTMHGHSNQYQTRTEPITGATVNLD